MEDCIRNRWLYLCSRIGVLIVIFYTTQKPPYSYEVELKDGSIEESFDCYEKDEKKICEIDLEKKVVVDYWKIEK